MSTPPLPDLWRSRVEARLEAGETPIASFEPNLDHRLHFTRAILVLTGRRLLAFQDDEVQAWSLGADHSLRSSEQSSLGTLDLIGPSGRLTFWRFTVGNASAARAFVQSWESAQSGGTSTQGTSICPSCGAVMAATDTTCPACTPETRTITFTSLARLIGFAKPWLKYILLGFFLTWISTTAGLIPPYLTKPLLDEVLIPYSQGEPGVRFEDVYWYLGGLLLAAILAWMLEWARSYFSSWVSERISADLRQRTYSHLQRLSLEFFGGRRTGDLMSRLSTDTDRLCNFLSSHLVEFVKDVLMIAMTAGILIYFDPLLALASLAPFPVIVYLVHWFRNRMIRSYNQSSVAWADMNSILADTIPGIRVVKAFAQEQREIDRFNETNQRVVHTNDRVNLMWAFFSPIITLLTTIGLLLVWAFAAWRIFHGAITVGTLTMFVAYITAFYARSESLIRIFSYLQRAGNSTQRIFEILDRVPSVPEPNQPVPIARMEGSIELRGVRFKYGPREVIHGIDLKIEPGEMIGLVGPSGAGKSTLINLLCRFFDVAQGAILVDGTDIRSYPLEAYRKNIGIVLQEPFLFYGTIAENIAYGRPEATREEIVAAARAAHAHEFILKLADGYDSFVGERGQSLSGGERQRISIARALLVNPRILILDEATSAVDTETEREIQAALETLIQGRTTIAIAHRLSTLRKANRIVVIDRGLIAETGTHAELLRLRGKYAQLHRAQIEMAQGHAV